MKENDKVVLSWLKDEGAVLVDNNLIMAEKAFFANSVIRWYKKQIKEGTMKGPQIDNCIFILRRFNNFCIPLFNF